MGIKGKIYGINGPVVTIKGNPGYKMNEMVYVGERRLVGEVIGLAREATTIQVYEETSGLRPGEPVEGVGSAISVTLAPGILSNIFDGIERPLEVIARQSGVFIPTGAQADALDRDRLWETHVTVQPGDQVAAGSVIAQVPETKSIMHRVMLPPGVSGEVIRVQPDGEYTIEQELVAVRTGDGREISLSMTQKWPIRIPRPVMKRFPADRPLITGQRILDTLFPIAKGGTAALPGGFGTGKTMTQHQLAKWCDADIIIYIGCGERGNEMTDVLNEFPELKDPRTGESLMQRTVLIANTSDMPVAAREASIYTGITIAEFFRDMGYSVALMADSTSRWAEALREMSGRLEEMPGEEGYPAYLGSRLAQFYERAGRVVCLGNEGRVGTLTAIGAVSPPGGDISEPVSQATLRIVKVFWGLDASLAYKRHFPAINWLTSYSLYQDKVDAWADENVDPDFSAQRTEAMRLLQTEAELQEIVQLVGVDALSHSDRLILEVSRSIREDFLHQNSFHEVDTYTSLHKQYRMMKLILTFYKEAGEAIKQGVGIQKITKMDVVERIGRAKYVEEVNVDKSYDEIETDIRKEVQELIRKEADEL